MSNSSYYPDKYIILELTLEGKEYYKVFASWGGDYLNGPSWKFSSAIKEIKEDELYPGYIICYNLSGSAYYLLKGSYGVSHSFNELALDAILDQLGDNAKVLLPYEADSLVGKVLYEGE